MTPPRRPRETGRAPAGRLPGAWAGRGGRACVWRRCSPRAGPADRAAAPEGMEAVADEGTAMPAREVESVTRRGARTGDGDARPGGPAPR